MTAIAASPPFGTLIRFAAGRRAFEPHALPAYGLCLFGAFIALCAVMSGAFDYDRALVANVAGLTALVLAFTFAARWIGFPALADPVEQLFLLMLLGLIYAFCSVILASTAAPLADPVLRQADMMLFGIDRIRFIADLELSPLALRFWILVYNSFAYTPALALLLLVASGHRRLAWALVTALCAAAVVSIAFLLVLPAYGTPPFPYEFIGVFDGARDGSLRRLDGSVITGLVTFPSLHAADAVILACAFMWLGRWALPLVVLKGLMFVSALIVGGHYVVDLIAGAVVGVAALYGALWLHARLPPPTRSAMQRR